MKILLLILMCQGAALASPYVDNQDATDLSNTYVPENLLELSRQADQNKIDQFFQKLGCWKSDTEIVCKEGGKQFAYDFSQDGQVSPIITVR